MSRFERLAHILWQYHIVWVKPSVRKNGSWPGDLAIDKAVPGMVVPC